MEELSMKAIITGIAALAMAGGIASTEPAAALTVANIGVAQAAPSEGNVTQVQWRRHWRGRYWGGPRYYSYGYRPYYHPRYYGYGGPRLYIGPRGFGFGW